MSTQEEKARAFKALHERDGAFVIPNPWHPGAARVLTGLGYEASATTSSGTANSLGRPDGGLTLDEVLWQCEALCEATDLPVSADLENGFADSLEDVAETIRQTEQTGIVGASIEGLHWRRR